MRSRQRWDHLSSMVRHGLLHATEQTNELNIYASPVPSFRLGDTLPLFHGVDSEDIVHRFTDAEKREETEAHPLIKLLHRPHAQGMLSCAFWLCILLEFREKRPSQQYNPDEHFGIDKAYCDRLMLNLAFHYALFSADCEKELTGSNDDGTLRYAFFKKFAKLVIFGMAQLCSANVREIESSASNIEREILFWTLGIDVSEDADSSTGGPSAPVANSAAAQPESGDSTNFRSVTARDVKLKRYREFCDDGRNKKGGAGQMISVVVGEAPTRMPLYARSAATKKGVGGGESAEVTKPEAILHNVQLEHMVKSLEDELAESRSREEEKNRLEREMRQSLAAGRTLGNMWQESRFASVSRLGATSVTPLMKMFLEACSIQSQRTLQSSSADVSSLQRSSVSPVNLMSSKMEQAHGRRGLPSCSNNHELSVEQGHAQCSKCGWDAAVGGRFLTCDICSEVLCRQCSGKENSRKSVTLPTAVDVFGRDAVAEECVYTLPKASQVSLVRKIVADRCSSGLVTLIKTVQQQRKQPANLFDMQVRHATWVGQQADKTLDKAIVDAATAALTLPTGEQQSVASNANCTGSVAPAPRWRPVSPSPSSANQPNSRPQSALSRPQSALSRASAIRLKRPNSPSVLGAFLTDDYSLGQNARQSETQISSPSRGPRPGSAASAPGTDSRHNVRSVSTPSVLLRPQSALSNTSSIRTTLHVSTRPDKSRISWSKLQASEVRLLDDKRARLQAEKQNILERVKIINSQSASAEEAQKEFSRHVVREEARNSLECFQESKAALRKLRLREKHAVVTAADEVVEAMEATTQKLHGLDEIDCIKTALITINKHFEALPENVRKHAIAFAGRYKPKLLQMVREYKMQYRDKSLWPPSLDDPNRTRAMDQTSRSTISYEGQPREASEQVARLSPPQEVDVLSDDVERADQAPLDAKVALESMLAAQTHDFDAERRILADRNKREAIVSHERHIQQLAGIEVRAVGRGLVVAGGQVLWADSNRAVGAEAAEVRSRYLANKLYR